MSGMRVIEIAQPGGPEVLRLAERPVPQCASGELLVRVHAFGINRPDVLQRRGLYPPPPGASDIPGLEICGEVVAGEGDDGGFKPGDMVCALVAGGGYAEYCVVPAAQCLPMPRGLSAEQAAALPETAFTVWHNLIERGQLRSGEATLVHGGSSGIGTMAIQVAKARGARVIVTVGSASKAQACLDLGADHAVVYREADFVEAVLEATDGRGADVILDMVAGDYLARDQRCLAEDGRIVVIAVQGGSQSTIDAARLMRRRQTLTGSTLRARSAAFKAQLAQAVRAQLWPLIEKGAVRPVMDRVMPAAETAQAHARMEAGQHVGKIVLTWA